MKLLITADSPGLEAPVNPRFGRAAYFVIVDNETMQWLVHANPGVSAAGGAGSQAAQFAAWHGVDAVISGDFGPNAHIVLTSAEIRMYLLGTSRTVGEAVAYFNAGVLHQVQAPTGTGHHGGRST
jgi:predicted Fe-Mo cluster-binding NifX family protein